MMKGLMLNRLLSLGLIATLGLLCLLVSCKSPVEPEQQQSDTYFTVSFDSDGGKEVPDIKNVLKGTLLNISSSDYWSKRSGYLFDGWYLQGDTQQKRLASIRVNGNITVVAKWAKLFSVTLEMGEGGTLGSSPNLTSFLYGSTFEVGSYTPYRKGFLFQYWYLKEDLSKAAVQSIRIEKDITLVAEWKEGWTVTLVLNGGSYVRDYITVAKGDNVTVSLADIKPVRQNYVFEGWYYDAGLNNPVPGDTIPVTGNINLYAKWTSLAFIESLLGVWTAGNDGPAYYLYIEENRLLGFYFSLNDIRSFVWTSSSLDGKSYSFALRTLRVGEGEDAKTFTPVTDKRTPVGNVPLNGTWIMAEDDADLFKLYFGGAIALYLSADKGIGSIRANSRYLDISYVVTGGCSNLYLLKKNVATNCVLLQGEVLLRIPIEDGKPSGYQKFIFSGPIQIF
jgi:uncharacterized repeat protein (TIGR02543 family)